MIVIIMAGFPFDSILEVIGVVAQVGFPGVVLWELMEVVHRRLAGFGEEKVIVIDAFVRVDQM